MVPERTPVSPASSETKEDLGNHASDGPGNRRGDNERSSTTIGFLKEEGGKVGKERSGEGFRGNERASAIPQGQDQRFQATMDGHAGLKV